MPDDVSAQYDATPRPSPDPEIRGAVSRPGFVSPHPVASVPVELAESIARRVGQAQNLQRIATNWRHDATWPALRVALKADYVGLLNDESPSAVYLRDEIAELLHIRPENSDTARLDALLGYLNDGMRGQPWTREAIDRLMEGNTP